LWHSRILSEEKNGISRNEPQKIKIFSDFSEKPSFQKSKFRNFWPKNFAFFENLQNVKNGPPV